MASSSAMRKTERARSHFADGSRRPLLDDPLPLTRAQIREIKRRVRYAEDRTRYLLVSSFSPRLALYYDASDDVFAMNDPSRGTLFKRPSMAGVIQSLLDKHVEVVQCRVSRRGRLIKKSVPRLRVAWRDSLDHRQCRTPQHA
jgi:hypothetical protein